MSNVKISDLTENTNPSGSEELVYADNGSNGKMTLDTIKTYAATSGAYVYKGSVATFEDLPSQNLTNGDAYNVQSEFILNGKEYPADTNVAWNGSSWDALGGSASGYQKTKYRTNVEIDPNTMVDQGESIIKTNVLFDSVERLYYTAWFNSGESTIYIYTSRYNGSLAERTLEHTFDAGFAPLSGVCAYTYAYNDGGLGSRYSLILWNHEKMAVFYAPQASVFHYSNETHYYVGDTIDWSIPFSSVYDINMFSPSEFQVGSLTFAGLWGDPFNFFGKIAFGDDFNYVNTITGWNGQDFYTDWLAPQPGTVVTCKNIKYQYIGGTPETLYYGTVNNTPAVWCILGSNVVAKQTNNNDGITDTTLFDAHIDVGSNKTLGAFSTSGGTAGGKLWGPIDLSEYYLGYGAKDIFLKTTDTNVLKTTDIKNNLSIETSETQTYNGAVIKAIDNKTTPISYLEYNYDKSSNGSFSNDGYLCDFVWFNDNNGLIGFSHDNPDDLSSWRLIFVDEYLQWGEILDGNDNPIVLQDETGDNSQLRSLCVNEDGTKILCFTATGKFYYYTMSTPYDYETITYSGSYETIDSNVTVPMLGAAMSPNGKYVYIMEQWTGNVYVYKTATPYSPASLTYINTFNHGGQAGGGAPSPIRESIGFSPDGKYALIAGNIFENKEKFLIDGTIVQNMSEDNWLYLHGGYTLSTPLSDRIILNKTLCWSVQHTQPGYGNIKFPSWNSTISAAAEAFAPVTNTTSTDELVITNLTTVFAPTEGFSLSCGLVKPGMSYIVRLTSGATAYTMTLGTGITNPYNETLTLTASKTTTIVLLATSDTELEIQSVRTAA